MVDNFKYGAETQKIIGAAMKVHRCLGGGNFTEIIFQRALVLELRKQEIFVEVEKEFPVYYENTLIGKKRVDILAQGKILLELKATSQLEKMHFNQVINYLKVFNLEIGLLINFGTPSLQFKRFVNNCL
jgi:GxxExxY protein